MRATPSRLAPARHRRPPEPSRRHACRPHAGHRPRTAHPARAAPHARPGGGPCAGPRQCGDHRAGCDRRPATQTHHVVRDDLLHLLPRRSRRARRGLTPASGPSALGGALTASAWLACPRCQQATSFWASCPVVPWDRDTALIMTTLASLRASRATGSRAQQGWHHEHPRMPVERYARPAPARPFVPTA